MKGYEVLPTHRIRWKSLLALLTLVMFAPVSPGAVSSQFRPDYAVSATIAPNPVLPGGIVTATFSVTNTGNTSPTDYVAVGFVMGSSATITSATCIDQQGESCLDFTHEGAYVYFRSGLVGPPGVPEGTVATVTVTAVAASEGLIEFSEIYFDYSGSDADFSNNVAGARTTIVYDPPQLTLNGEPNSITVGSNSQVTVKTGHGWNINVWFRSRECSGYSDNAILDSEFTTGGGANSYTAFQAYAVADHSVRTECLTAHWVDGWSPDPSPTPSPTPTIPPTPSPTAEPTSVPTEAPGGEEVELTVTGDPRFPVTGSVALETPGLAYTLIDSPDAGTVSLVPDGTFTYVAVSQSVTFDQFLVQASDRTTITVTLVLEVDGSVPTYGEVKPGETGNGGPVEDARNPGNVGSDDEVETGSDDEYDDDDEGPVEAR